MEMDDVFKFLTGALDKLGNLLRLIRSRAHFLDELFAFSDAHIETEMSASFELSAPHALIHFEDRSACVFKQQRTSLLPRRLTKDRPVPCRAEDIFSGPCCKEHC